MVRDSSLKAQSSKSEAERVYDLSLDKYGRKGSELSLFAHIPSLGGVGGFFQYSSLHRI